MLTTNYVGRHVNADKLSADFTCSTTELSQQVSNLRKSQVQGWAQVLIPVNGFSTAIVSVSFAK